MELSYILSNLILWMFINLTWGEPLKRYQTPCPNECDLKKCPKLQFCDGEIVKDRCRCCPDCSTNIGFNSSYAQKDGACKQVSCPRFKVCMENMQGLPLCTCPNPFVCKGRRRHVCGKDGNTYESRCHLRVTSCHKSKRIRMAHKGACGMVGTQEHGTNVKYKETEFDISAKRRKNRKQLKRKNKKSKKRRRRKQKNRKNRRTKRRRTLGPKAKRAKKERRKNNLKDKTALKNG
ncbi:follistatin-like [Mytilus californianus]|uniref:follistatin-like n=1 Tax=Mytilus californianus TaxID=6549 RepID=UPI0022454378|nr:follistatin-like [Mytilus californianus]